MVGKLCSGPKGGGSSSGLTTYLVGYAIAGKGASKDEIEAALDAVYLEAETREDLGVGRVWNTTAGHGTRPSSILVRNCASFSTAAMEMDSDAAMNPGVKHAAMHFVWSFSTAESEHLTDEQAHKFVLDVADRLGLSDHRMQLVVHRDTIVKDASGKIIDGNLHVHAAIGSVDPRTGLAYDRTGLFKRMARAEREVELAHGLDHDRGLYVVRDPGTSLARIEAASPDELAAWRRERREERLVALERRSAEGYRKRDQDFDRYADATVAPRMRAAMDSARQRGREPEWGMLHAVGSRYGCELQREDDGRVILRDVGTGQLRIANEKERRKTRKDMTAAGIDHEQIDGRLAAMKAEHEAAEAAERDRKRREGDVVPLDAVLGDDCADMPAFQDEEAAELAVIAMVQERPEIVLRDLTAESSTFSRDDVDRWLGARIADPEAMERLGDLVVGHESVRALSADTRYPLLTTTEILDIEDRLHADAAALAARPSGFTADDIRAAIRTYEAEMAEASGKSFRLSDEQREALMLLERGSLVALEGLPGTGKTTIQGVVNLLCTQKATEASENRPKRKAIPVIGLTLSQAAAERLQDEAKFECVNTSRALVMQRNREEVVPRGGLVVLDECGMLDSRSMGSVLADVREKSSIAVCCFDLRQLQSISAGASARIVRDVAKNSATYSELRDVQRQKRAWHREAVVILSDAMVETDDAKRLSLVQKAIGILDDHGAISWVADRDTAIDTAVSKTQAYRAAGFADTLLLAGDKDTVRHLSEQDRREAGREGAGRTYVTDGGRRELAVGDRFMFLENSLTGKRAIGVRNGDRGEVVEASASRISVRLDGEQEKVVSFSPRSYRNFDHGNASTIHKAQGASVNAAVSVMADRSASAELTFVALTRSKHALDMIVPLTAFADRNDLAEHISSRISLKTTTRNFEEVIARTGGRETNRVRNIEAQREAESSPLRRMWEGEVVEPLRVQRAERMRDLRESYDARKRELLGRPLAERLEADRDAMRSFRKAAAELHAATRPQTFSAWLKEQERDEQRVRETQRVRSAKRETQHVAERGRTISIERTSEDKRERGRGNEIGR